MLVLTVHIVIKSLFLYSDQIFWVQNDLCLLFLPHFPWRIWEERVSLLFLVGCVLTGVLAAHILVGGFGNPPRHWFWEGPWVVSIDSDRTILCAKATSVTFTDSYKSCQRLAIEPCNSPQAAARWQVLQQLAAALVRDVARMATVKAKRVTGLLLPH